MFVRMRAGNVMYMAPEVAETSSHGGHYGAKCDVFRWVLENPSGDAAATL
jgi:hypothetical protein